MIKLKDYLGTLISGVNQARVMADIESARIAQAYAKDNLLKHFPVPRFRAQDVELDIPIAIDGFEENPPIDYSPIDSKSFNSKTYNILKSVVNVSSFSRDTSYLVNSEIGKHSKVLDNDLKSNLTKDIAFKKFEIKVVELLQIAIKKDKLKINEKSDLESNTIASLREELYEQIASKPTYNLIEDTIVIVEAQKLREIPNENIIRIKMKLFEDGMEWHTSEDNNGNIKSNLLPE